MKDLYTVIGGGGFIGSRLIDKLISHGLDAWTPTRNSLEIYERNLGTVFYCAGYTDDYMADPFATLEAHVLQISKILQKASFDHLVYLSSTRLYDGLRVPRVDEQVSLALRSNNPRHLYDISKALGENLCLAFSGSRCSVARLSCVYDKKPSSPGFLSNLLQQIYEKKHIYLDSSPEICRDYICLDDAISGLLSMATHRPGKIVNIASGRNTYNYEISETMSKFGIELKFSGSTRPQDNVPVCDIGELLTLGVRPVDTIEYLTSFVESIYR